MYVSSSSSSNYNSLKQKERKEKKKEESTFAADKSNKVPGYTGRGIEKEGEGVAEEGGRGKMVET